MKYGKMKRALLEVAAVVSVVTVPLSVHAGVFASLVGMFEEVPKEIEDVSSPQNAQSVALLKAANHADPNPAKGGGDIIIDAGSLVPDGGVSASEMDEVNTRTANGEISVYIVREADTLSQIAEMFDVSASTILWANDITDGVIHPGQTLVILPITGVRHVVKDGDTIEKIAKKYDGDADDIISYNQLASASDISVGETIVIPNGVVSAPASSSGSSPSRVSGGRAVASGEGSSSFSHPLPGGIRTQGIHGYNGVDYGATAGTPVLAAANGEVIISKNSGWNGGYGNYIVIRHSNGTQTLYAHLSANEVGVGYRASTGEVIGYVGNTGRSTGNHLHFEVRGAKNPF